MDNGFAKKIHDNTAMVRFTQNKNNYLKCFKKM